MSYFKKWIDNKDIPKNINGHVTKLCRNKLWVLHKTFGNILGINPKVKAGLDFMYDVHYRQHPVCNNIHFLLAGFWFFLMEIKETLPKEEKPYIDIWLKERFNIRAKVIGEESIKKYIEDFTGLKVSFSEHVNYK